MPTIPAIAAIALGANLGDRAATLTAAAGRLGSIPGTTVMSISRFVETDPVGPIAQPRYLNAAAVVQTVQPPRVLLEAMLEIERSLGRDRASEQRWGPRTIDLDLLLYGGLTINEPGLTIPHPRMHERLFVLLPLAEIRPDLVVPTLGVRIAELRDRLLGVGTSRATSGSN